MLAELERDAHAGRDLEFDLPVSGEEKIRWAEAASTLGLSASEFVRDVANQAADEVLAGENGGAVRAAPERALSDN